MDNLEQLRKFKELLDEGLISEEEYETKKQQLLDGIQAEVKAEVPANAAVDAPAVVDAAVDTAADALGAGVTADAAGDAAGAAAGEALGAGGAPDPATFGAAAAGAGAVPGAAPVAAQIPAKKKPKTGIIIAVAAVVVLAIVGFLFLGKSKPLMQDGQYVGSVDKILDAVSSNAKTNVTGFTGFTKDTSVAGNYKVNGVTGQDLTMSFTKTEDGENIAVEDDEVPDTVILSSIMDYDDFGSQYDTYIKMGASIYSAIDPTVTLEAAYDKLKTCLSSALENGTGSLGVYTTTAGDVKIYTTVLVANNRVLLLYSFQEP